MYEDIFDSIRKAAEKRNLRDLIPYWFFKLPEGAYLSCL